MLAASEGAYQEVLAWFARQEGLALPPRGGLDRPELLHLLAFRDHDGLFRPGPLSQVVLDGFDGLGVDVRRVRLDGSARAAKWPGAHAFEGRVSLRRQGGLADWIDLPDAAGRAAVAATARPSTRDSGPAGAVGALGAWLLLEPRFIEAATGLDCKRSRDVVRRLALRLLFQLRTRAAALRVAVEVERGTGGRAWHEAHREALSRAALADWPEGLASRDADAETHRTVAPGRRLGGGHPARPPGAVRRGLLAESPDRGGAGRPDRRRQPGSGRGEAPARSRGGGPRGPARSGGVELATESGPCGGGPGRFLSRVRDVDEAAAGAARRAWWARNLR